MTVPLYEELKALAGEFIQDYGYTALFLLSFAESIIQPIPPYPFITAAPVFGLSPWIAAHVSFAGNLLGALVSFFLGRRLGEAFVKRLFGERLFLKGEALFNRLGFFAVLIGEPYKLMCWLSGIFKMSFLSFILASVIARFIRIYVFALFGEAIKRLFL